MFMPVHLLVCVLIMTSLVTGIPKFIHHTLVSSQKEKRSHQEGSQPVQKNSVHKACGHETSIHSSLQSLPIVKDENNYKRRNKYARRDTNQNKISRKSRISETKKMREIFKKSLCCNNKPVSKPSSNQNLGLDKCNKSAKKGQCKPLGNIFQQQRYRHFQNSKIYPKLCARTQLLKIVKHPPKFNINGNDDSCLNDMKIVINISEDDLHLLGGLNNSQDFVFTKSTDLSIHK